jgi:hypothetical protein
MASKRKINAIADDAGKYVLRSHGGSTAGSILECNVTEDDGVLADVGSLVGCSPQVKLAAHSASPLWLARLCFRPPLSLCQFG